MLKTEENQSGTDPGTTQLPERIILTGFRATGKSAVAKYLADLLDYRLIDTDQELAAQLGCSIARYVEQNGWQKFRKFEQQLLERLAAMRRAVISTGGGAVLHEDEWKRKISKDQ